MTPQEQQQLNKLLQEGIELAKKLGDTAAEASLTNFNGDLRTAELAVRSLRNEWSEYINDIKGAREGFTRIVDEIKNMNSGAKMAKSSFSGLASITAKLQSHQENINSLSSKELQSLKSKTGDRFNDLLLAGKLAKDEVKRLQTISQTRDLTRSEKKQLLEAKAAHENITNEITRSASFVKQLNDQLDDQLKKQIEIEKTLGLSGVLMKGMSKIPFLGDLPGMSNILKDVEDEVKEINKQRKDEGKEPLSRAEAMKMTFSKMKGVIKDSLTDPMAIVGFLVTQFIDALTKADTATGDLAKDFNITYDAAADLRNELIEIGNLSGNIALNARALQESMVAVGQSLGSNAMLNQADLETFTELREMAGYTNEELIGIQKLTLATGGNLKDNTKQFLGTVAALNAQNKLTINEKQLLKEVSNTSAAIKLSIGGTTKELASAAFQAKQFGINLEQADKIAESLLDFESSITAELEAELLTGKDLNLERARLLALNGDIAGASAEILKQVKGSAEFTKMNRIQQESLAKAVGMSREELAASLIEREALNNIGVKDAAAAKAKFDLLVKEKGYAAAVAELGDEQYANQLKQQSIQERFNKSVEKLQEIFIAIAEPVLQILDPIMEIVGALLPLVNVILVPTLALFKAIGKAISSSIKEPIEAVKNILGGIMDIFSGDFEKGFKKIGNGLVRVILSPFQAITGFVISMVNSIVGWANKIPGVEIDKFEAPNLTKMMIGDMYSPANGKTQVSTKEGGLFELSKNDSLFAFPESKISPNSGRSTPTSTNTITQQPIDYDKLASAIGKEVNNKPVIVENSMDGTKFGTSVAINTYKTQ